MRELRIYTGLPGKGKESRTLGRDRRRPSSHDPPPGRVGGFFTNQLQSGMLSACREPYYWRFTPHRGYCCRSANAPQYSLVGVTTTYWGRLPKSFNADCVGPKLSYEGYYCFHFSVHTFTNRINISIITCIACLLLKITSSKAFLSCLPMYFVLFVKQKGSFSVLFLRKRETFTGIVSRDECFLEGS